MSHWIVAGTLLCAGACAPVSQAAVGNSDPTPEPSINSPQTDRVLAFGFESIKERYLTDVVMGNVAFEGMRGLSTLDPALSVERDQPRRVVLRYHDEKVADYPAPPDNNSDAWAGLIATVARDAASVSPALRTADREKLYEAVFDATLAKLDMFSRYAGTAEAADHRAARDGFGGIGVRYDPHPEDIVLTEVMADTPSADAGLQVGDHITAVDGVSIAGQDQATISKRLRGPINSTVTLSVKKKGGQLTQVKLERSLIVPPTVTMTMKDGIATIAISSFNRTTAANTTADVKQAKATPGFKGVILDLRGNPGGLLDQGVAVADLFMSHGRIVSAHGRNPASVQSYDAHPGDPGEDVPLVVMVDGGSASAAEIVAAALEDSGRAVLVGTNSYGKGTVQTVIRMPNDGEMTLTWSRFYTPSGYALHGLGVLPTICTGDGHAQAAALFAPIRQGHSTMTTTMAAWRASTIDQQDARKQLRASCPSAKHADVALDAETARSLINDHSLYMQALSLTAPVTTASSAAVTVPANTP